METSLIPGGTQEKLKSYWNRPGGKFGTIALIGLLGAAGFYLIPILTTIVWNLVNFGIACACAAVLTYCLSHRTLRLSAFYFYEILMKGLVGLVWKIDPFVIADDLIKDMKKDREKLRTQLIDIDGEKERIAMKIAEKERDMQKQINQAKVQREQGNTMGVGNSMRQESRLRDFIRQLTPIKDSLEKVGNHLKKVYDSSKYLIEDAENELEIKKDLYVSVTKGNNGLQRALRLLDGDPEKKLLAAQSMEYLKNDIAGKVANIKLAMHTTSEFVAKIDLENATYEMEGLARLEQLTIDENFRLTPGAEMVPATARTVVTPVQSAYKDLI